MEINGKVVVITGASTGIGLSTARLFARHGAKLALIARSAEKLERLAAELPGTLTAPADLSDIPAIPGLFARIHKHFGAIDVLINNAGRGFHVPVEKADVDLYRALLDLNVVSVLSAMQCVIPIMRQQGGGVIVNISSGLSKRIVPGVGPYASTKYALNALTLTARMELEPDNIRVGLMLPGLTANTEFRANDVSAQDQPDQRRAGTMGDPVEHVAEKILEAVQTEAAEVYADSIRPR
jgi:short-subunit dehydrogenase